MNTKLLNELMEEALKYQKSADTVKDIILKEDNPIVRLAAEQQHALMLNLYGETIVKLYKALNDIGLSVAA